MPLIGCFIHRLLHSSHLPKSVLGKSFPFSPSTLGPRFETVFDLDPYFRLRGSHSCWPWLLQTQGGSVGKSKKVGGRRGWMDFGRAEGTEKDGCGKEHCEWQDRVWKLDCNWSVKEFENLLFHFFLDWQENRIFLRMGNSKINLNFWKFIDWVLHCLPEWDQHWWVQQWKLKFSSLSHLAQIWAETTSSVSHCSLVTQMIGLTV